MFTETSVVESVILLFLLLWGWGDGVRVGVAVAEHASSDDKSRAVTIGGVRVAVELNVLSVSLEN